MRAQSADRETTDPPTLRLCWRLVAVDLCECGIGYKIYCVLGF